MLGFTHSLSRMYLLGLLAVLTPVAVSAQTTLTVTDGLEASSLAGQGWNETAPGLWERAGFDGRMETYVTGKEGLRNVLPRLHDHMQKLFDAYLADPSSENKRALSAHQALIESVKANAGKPGGIENVSESLARPAACTRTFNYGVEFTFDLHYCNEEAKATASYSVSNAAVCPELCTVHAYSYAAQKWCLDTQVSTYDESCTTTGTNVSCTTFAHGTPGSNCYRYAFASISCPQLNSLYLSQSDYRTSCQCTC